jgi:hypothetical protein
VVTEAMHRWIPALFFLALTGAVIVLFSVEPAKARAPQAPSAAPAGEPILALDSKAPAVVATLEAPPPAPSGPLGELPALPKENPGAGATFLDGSTPEPLPKSAPSTVRFAVMLVTYRGAEQADQQPRTREQALTLAKKLAEEAKTDFLEAGKRADVLVPDAGTLQQGVLEPAPQALLFGSEVGSVSGPVDSPRGFYVFKRLE